MNADRSNWHVHGLARIGLTGFIVMLAHSAACMTSPVNLDSVATIKTTIEARFPGTEVIDVQPTAIAGLYEVFDGEQIIYTSVDADYLLMGPLVETKTQQNVTQHRLAQRRKIEFSTLPLESAIKVVKGNGRRRFAVFSDPDCPFCQQLERALLSVNDITMYVFLFPIAALHPQAPAKARAIWCAPDHAKSWEAWMHDRALPTAPSCNNDPLDALQTLGEKLRINSTPTLFLADGRRVEGALSAPELERLLAPDAAVDPSK